MMRPEIAEEFAEGFPHFLTTVRSFAAYEVGAEHEQRGMPHLTSVELRTRFCLGHKREHSLRRRLSALHS